MMKLKGIGLVLVMVGIAGAVLLSCAQSGPREANAQEPGNGDGGSPCSQYEVTMWSVYSDTECAKFPDILNGQTCRVPAGWEPFVFLTEGRFMLRRCLS